MKKGILLHEKNDDVGVAVMDLRAGEEISALTLEGEDVKLVTLVTDIPLGHKVAMKNLAANSKVIEYGRVIGSSAAPINAGEHVHIHNLKSLRWTASSSRLFEK